MNDYVTKKTIQTENLEIMK